MSVKAKLYSASSLDELGDEFERRAEFARRNAQACKVIKHQLAYKAEASAWETAAEILRTTEIKEASENTR